MINRVMRSTMIGALALAVVLVNPYTVFGSSRTLGEVDVQIEHMVEDMRVHSTLDGQLVIALVEELDDLSARAQIIRRNAPAPQNVIFVTKETTAADLSKAMNALAVSRERFADGNLPGELRAFITKAEGTVAERSRNLELATQELRRLADATPQQVEGLGTYPIVEVDVDLMRKGFRSGSQSNPGL